MNQTNLINDPIPQDVSGDTVSLPDVELGNAHLLRRNFVDAKACFDRALQAKPNDPDLNLSALLAALRFTKIEELNDTAKDFSSTEYWKRAYTYADPKMRKQLDRILKSQQVSIHYYHAHTILAKAKKPQDYSRAAYELAQCIRTDDYPSDATRLFRECEKNYQELTGTTLALAEDLRPDREMLLKTKRDRNKPLPIPLFEDASPAAKRLIKTDPDPSEAPERTALQTEENGIEYRPDVDTVYQSAEEKEAIAQQQRTAEQIEQRLKNKKRLLRIGVPLVAVAVIAGGIYYAATYKDHARKRAYTQLEAGNYSTALELITKAMGGDTSMRTDEEDAFIEECYYGLGQDALEQGDLATAADYFHQADDFSDAEICYQKCHYELGERCMNDNDYYYAVDHFEKIIGYEDAYHRCYDAKYQYVLANFEQSDQNTKHYLEDLKFVGYGDCAALYQELYGWRLENMVVNSSEGDETTDQYEFHASDVVLFHFDIAGGPGTEDLLISTKTTKPDGSTIDYTFENEWPAGQSCWFGWKDGLTTTKSGELTVDFYDQHGNLIASKTIYLKK